jgi:hypothetical protein
MKFTARILIQRGVGLLNTGKTVRSKGGVVMRVVQSVATALVGMVLSSSTLAESTKKVEPSLTIGTVEFRLGMTKTDVASILPKGYFLFSIGGSTANYGASEKQATRDAPDEDVLGVCEHGAGSDVECWGDVEFKVNKLIFASRQWNVAKPETVDTLLSAVVNGLQAVSVGNHDNPFSVCKVRVDKKSLPDHDESGATVFCGERTLVIDNGNYSTSGTKKLLRSVEESIGER